jgi:hypothetical protein
LGVHARYRQFGNRAADRDPGGADVRRKSFAKEFGERPEAGGGDLVVVGRGCAALGNGAFRGRVHYGKVIGK